MENSILIKLIILDIDGVLTDGKKYYDGSGTAAYKTFCDKDFTAIKKFKSVKIEVIFLSGDNKINEAIAKNRNIPFYYTRGMCKSEFLHMLLEKYNCLSDETVFRGDDTFDLEIMKKVKYAFCPSDAPKEIKKISHVLNKKGGDNCVLELYEWLLERDFIPNYSIENIYAIDKHEKF